MPNSSGTHHRHKKNLKKMTKDAKRREFINQEGRRKKRK
jgi:hypothetical protein